MLENQSYWIEVDGGQVHYLIEGPEDGRPIVLLHGASFRADTWKDLGTMTGLAQAGWLVYAVDLPGFGQSSAPKRASRFWLRTLLDRLRIRTPVLVSPSMSGAFAFPLVIDDPDRVAAWIAVAPVGVLNHQNQLDRINTPVLAVWGEKDRTIPLDQADLLAEGVPNGRKVIIPGASHAPYMNDSKRFLNEMLKFLTEIP
jgi:pimeloyl-ACP methyl ester carboxylesterase